jgi:hypothetical protein
MKDKRLTDLEDKIKNDVLKGTFNLGDHNDPNSVIGMAMSFLRGANNLGVEEHEPADPTTVEEEPQEAPSGSYIPFGRLGGVGVMKCNCGCWEGKICTNSKRIIK